MILSATSLLRHGVNKSKRIHSAVGTSWVVCLHSVSKPRLLSPAIYINMGEKKVLFYWGQSWHRGIKYELIISFLRFSIEAKRGVNFRHSTRNVSRICE